MTLDKTDLIAIGKLIDSKLESLAIMTAKGFAGVDERFKQVDKRFDKIDKRFDAMDGRLEDMDIRMDGFGRKFDRILDEISDIKTRLNSIEKCLSLNVGSKNEIIELRKRVEVLERKIKVA